MSPGPPSHVTPAPASRSPLPPSYRPAQVCPYHGWAFDGAGRLRDVPSADRGTWPKRALVGSYAVRLWAGAGGAPISRL
jgi:hypothetical protein